MRSLIVSAMLAMSGVAVAGPPYEEVVLATFARAGDAQALGQLMLPGSIDCIPHFPHEHMDTIRTAHAFKGVRTTVLHLEPVWDATLRRGQPMRRAGCSAPHDLRFVTLIARLRIAEAESLRTFEAKARLDVMRIDGTWYLRHPPFDFYEIGTLGAVFASEREKNADLQCACRDIACFTGAHSEHYELETVQPADAIIEPIAPRFTERIRAANRRAIVCTAREFSRFNRRE